MQTPSYKTILKLFRKIEKHLEIREKLKDRAHEKLAELEDHYFLRNLLENIGLCYMRTKKFADSLVYHTKAMDLVKDFEHQAFKRIKNQQIECEIKLSQIPSAVEMLDTLADYCKTVI